MWSKKKQDKDSKTVVHHTQNNHVTQTSHNLSVRTFEERSLSMFASSSTSTTSFLNSAGSIPRLDNNNLQPLPPLSSSKKSASTSALGRSSIDARPVGILNSPKPNINLAYQSPYRNSPAYRSFQTPSSTTNATTGTIFRRPLPSTVQPIPSINEPTKRSVVKKTRQLYDGRSPVPTYETHSRNRGEVLIINNIMFKDKGYRHGAEVDHKRLKDVFEQMGFKVTVETNLKKSSMASKVKSFSKRSSLFTADIAVLVVMSHGTKSESLGGTEVFGLDEQGVLVEDLMENFNEQDCKSMAKKPKIFIFQCCRGDNEQFVQNDAVRTPTKVSALSNALIAYSSLPGLVCGPLGDCIRDTHDSVATPFCFVSHRDPIHGTWYITTLCEVFSQHAHEYHVEDLLKMVDVKLGSMAKNVKQTTHYENRGFKRCYFHPV